MSPTQQLARRIATADHAYRAGRSVLTDAEFDAMVATLRAAAPNHPVLRVPGGGTCLLSLGNQDLDDWLAALGDAARGAFTVTPKIDGCALALRYEQGRLVAAWTRSGRCAIHVAWLVASIPTCVPHQGALEVRGELYGLDGKQSTPAAALRRKVPSGEGLDFVAFEVIGSDGTHVAQLKWLEDLGFEAAPHVLATAAGVRELHAAWQHGDLYSLLPTDGIVATVNDPTQRRRLGVTSVAPRYALALK